MLALAAIGLAWLIGGIGNQSQVEMSRWRNSPAAQLATDAGGATLLNGQARLIAGEAGSVAMLPLPSDGPFRLNVVTALEANGGALQRVLLPPGGRWSFNRAVGDPGVLRLATINGIYGGGWCDLASRYVMALRPFLPPEALVFPRHRDVAGISLVGVADDDAVAIWNTNNSGGEQDLVITNPTSHTILISARLVESGVEVRAVIQ